jgi:hypothetical protein
VAGQTDFLRLACLIKNSIVENPRRVQSGRVSIKKFCPVEFSVRIIKAVERETKKYNQN